MFDSKVRLRRGDFKQVRLLGTPIYLLCFALGGAAVSCGAENAPNDDVETIGEAVTTCSGTSCNGKDPAEYFCSPGTVEYSTDFYNQYNIKVGLLKRKKGCGAYWAWVDFENAQPGIVYMSGDEESTRYPTGTEGVFELSQDRTKWIDQAYSSMWASGLACVSYQYSSISSNTVCVP